MASVEALDPIARSAALKQEADRLLDSLNVYTILAPSGRVVATGSYFLDVMVYPDIDLYIPTVSIEQIFHMGAQFAAAPNVIQVVFEPSRDDRLPGGRYLKARIDAGDWGRPWKLDVWSLDDALIDRNMQAMLRFRLKMTPPLREQIIRYKTSLLSAEHRTPPYSGFFIYAAFLDEGLIDPQLVTEYLIAHGIHLE